MTRIKICGLTNSRDVQTAASLGVEMLGFIHVPGTPRHVHISRLRELLAAVSKPLQRVVVVRDAESELLARLRDELDFDFFQFHGSEDPETVSRWRGYKVVHVHENTLDHTRLSAYGSPFLLDTQWGARRGGTGKAFDWSLLTSVSGDYLVAGGLNPENVGSLVRNHQPWGVDVSSGIESAPGIKDHRKMRAFIKNVRSERAV